MTPEGAVQSLMNCLKQCLESALVGVDTSLEMKKKNLLLWSSKEGRLPNLCSLLFISASGNIRHYSH